MSFLSGVRRILHSNKSVRIRRTSVVLGVFLLSLFASTRGEARELQGRLGLGYNAQFIDPSTSQLRVPGISIKLGISRGLAVEFVEGIITSNPVTNVTGLKAFQNIFFEQYLNFYFMVGAAITTVKGNSGFAALTGFGSEFFIPGLESLGFSVETGIAYDNSGGNYALRTMGISFLDAGIHFYF